MIMKAIKDILYMIGLWFIGRADQMVLATLLDKWSKSIINKRNNENQTTRK